MSGVVSWVGGKTKKWKCIERLILAVNKVHQHAKTCVHLRCFYFILLVELNIEGLG